jgi:hypothetical protein
MNINNNTGVLSSLMFHHIYDVLIVRSGMLMSLIVKSIVNVSEGQTILIILG